MEGKDYPTRSKSGVRKIRTPWDNSSSLLFDELVKRSPKTPPTRGKTSYTPSPKTTGGKKTPGQSPAGTKTPGSKEKKVQRGTVTNFSRKKLWESLMNNNYVGRIWHIM